MDQDIAAHRVPRGAVGWYTYQGPLGMDFRVSRIPQWATRDWTYDILCLR